MRLNISCVHLDPASDCLFILDNNLILVLKNFTKIINKLLGFNRSNIKLIIIKKFADEFRIPSALPCSIDGFRAEIDVNIREAFRTHIKLTS